MANFKNVVFIPARAGSKSINLKNIKPINGKPLVYWAIKAACECNLIDAVFVSTDSQKIFETVEGFQLDKVHPIGRSADSATDSAPTITSVLEFADKYDFETLVLLQATSPLITSEDIEHGLKIFNNPNVDSVVSCVPQKRFIWNEDNNGLGHPINYDFNARPRRQDFEGYYVENGAMYIISRNALLTSKNYLSGNVRICKMPPETYLELDEPSDWNVIENLLNQRNN